MKHASVIGLLIMLSGISFLMITCKHEIPDPLIPPGTGPDTTVIPLNTCSPDTVYFVNEVFPLINSRCAASGGCHDEASHENGVVLTGYNSIMNYVVPGNASNSQLYQLISVGSMPLPPRPALTEEEMAKIGQWINQGAKNNECTHSCDTAVFTYSGLVSPIMASHCTGCHNPELPSGEVDLSSYENVKATALDGDLIGTISYHPPHIPMPQGDKKLKLPDCTIGQIQKWIDAGMLQ